MSSKQVAIFSWSIPQGGLPKVMLKEYYEFKKRSASAFILTLNPIPDAYRIDFARINAEHCLEALPEIKNKKTDISDFLPGLKISMRGSFLNNVINLIRYLQTRNFSIIIAHQLLSAYLLMPYCLIYRKPFLLILHDNPFLFMEKVNLKNMSIIRRFEATLVYLLSNVVISASKSTVCTTPQIKKEVKKHLKMRKELTVAEYGIDSFPAVLSKDRKILLTVSKWSEFRNPTAYLELLKILPTTINLVMVGRWDTEIEQKRFRVEIQKQGLEERLLLMDNISEEELHRLYDKARVFLRLGFNESGTGQAILEAIGHGCPVVMSRGLGASSMVVDGETGFLVDETSLADVANKIVAIFNDEQIVRRMSKNAYEIAKRHSWQAYLDTLYALTE